ncbi:MAG: FG-GAP-like repeat-containing protein, partial [Candidatus Sulfotelmatobacter sp.]
MDSGNPLFLGVVDYDFGYPAYTVVADLNGDGKPDLVVANSYGCASCDFGAVGVLLGNGDGTFQPEAGWYSTGDNLTTWLAVADVNGDGKLDVIVANQSLGVDVHGSVTVFLGNGDGTLKPGVIYDSGAYGALSVAVGDVNGDGKPDLLVANECDAAGCSGRSTAGVLLGNGDGTFQPAVLYDAGGEYANSIAVADLRGDGELDLVITISSSRTVSVLLGNGDGTFQPLESYDAGGSGLSSAAVADVNGDGRPDLMIGESGALAGVLLGNGDGTFREATTYNTGSGSTNSVAVSDVNGDGKPDLVTVNGNSTANVAVLLGNGDGSFQSALLYESGGLPSAVAVGDVNGDGRPDIVVTNPYYCAACTTPSVGVMLNNMGPHTPTTTSLAASANPAAVRTTVNYTATVAGLSGGPVNGSVTFADGGATVATVAVSDNQAVYSVIYRTVGLHPITAAYSGDLHNSASLSSAVVEDVEGTSKTTLVTSGSPSLVGQPVTFTAAVSSFYGKIPDGELVTFSDAGTAIGTGTTANGVAIFTTSLLTAKTHGIKATYSGDTTFESSHGATHQVVDGYPTAVSLISSPNPSVYGQAVTFTATVASSGASVPTGRVTFTDGTTTIGSAAVSGGVATFKKPKLAVGSHSITAAYDGDTVSAKSTSSAVIQVV